MKSKNILAFFHLFRYLLLLIASFFLLLFFYKIHVAAEKNESLLTILTEIATSLKIFRKNLFSLSALGVNTPPPPHKEREGVKKLSTFLSFFLIIYANT